MGLVESGQENWTYVQPCFMPPTPVARGNSKGPFIATQLNSTQLDVELSSVELSCVAIDTLTDATQLSPAIGNANDPVAAFSQSARSRSDELSCVSINGP